MSGLIADVSGAGPAVVLLHGQPGSRGDWAAVARRLEPDHLVVVPDRPGYGDTGGRARGFRANAAAVVVLLDRLGIERATVVGYSWAGGAAIALAAEAPERLAGLVLVSSVCPGYTLSRLDRMLAVPPIGTAVTAGGLFLARGALAIPSVRRALERRHRPTAAGPVVDVRSTDGIATDRLATDRPPTDRPATDRFGARGRHPQSPVGRDRGAGTGEHRDHLAAWVSRPARRVSRPARPDHRNGWDVTPDPDALVTAWRHNRVWESFVTEQQCLIDELPFLASGLTGIAAPTIVLQGAADRTVVPAAGRQLAAAIPGARLVELAGGGHLLLHQRPAAVADAVRDVTPR